MARPAAPTSGVGRAVGDMFTEAGLRAVRVAITAGTDAVTQDVRPRVPHYDERGGKRGQPPMTERAPGVVEVKFRDVGNLVRGEITVLASPGGLVSRRWR